MVPRCIVKAVQDDIFAKTVPIWLHHTVGNIFMVLQAGHPGEAVPGRGGGVNTQAKGTIMVFCGFLVNKFIANSSKTNQFNILFILSSDLWSLSQCGSFENAH